MKVTRPSYTLRDRIGGYARFDPSFTLPKSVSLTYPRSQGWSISPTVTTVVPARELLLHRRPSSAPRHHGGYRHGVTQLRIDQREAGARLSDLRPMHGDILLAPLELDGVGLGHFQSALRVLHLSAATSISSARGPASTSACASWVFLSAAPVASKVLRYSRIGRWKYHRPYIRSGRGPIALGRSKADCAESTPARACSFSCGREPFFNSVDGPGSKQVGLALVDIGGHVGFFPLDRVTASASWRWPMRDPPLRARVARSLVAIEPRNHLVFLHRVGLHPRCAR